MRNWVIRLAFFIFPLYRLVLDFPVYCIIASAKMDPGFAVDMVSPETPMNLPSYGITALLYTRAQRPADCGLLSDYRCISIPHLYSRLAYPATGCFLMACRLYPCLQPPYVIFIFYICNIILPDDNLIVKWYYVGDTPAERTLGAGAGVSPLKRLTLDTPAERTLEWGCRMPGMYYE